MSSIHLRRKGGRDESRDRVSLQEVCRYIKYSFYTILYVVGLEGKRALGVCVCDRRYDIYYVAFTGRSVV